MVRAVFLLGYGTFLYLNVQNIDNDADAFDKDMKDLADLFNATFLYTEPMV
jgi:hypothetical protein